MSTIKSFIDKTTTPYSVENVRDYTEQTLLKKFMNYKAKMIME